MITEQELKQLEPLTEHPKFGPILIRAIETWKNNKITINSFGIIQYQLGENYFDGFKYKVYHPDIGCCLIGASVIDLKFKNDMANPFDIINQFTNISNDEFYSLIDGFDLTPFGTRGYDKEAYDFARQVRLILKCIMKQ